MNLKNKYIKCFDQEKADQLQNAGYKFLYENNGTFYFENNIELSVKFSQNNLLEDTKFSMWLNF